MPRIRPETRNEIERRIEEEALNLFIRHGFAATTTRDIARASGFTAGALYNHYESKEALFASVVENYRHRLRVEETPLQKALDETRFPDDIPKLARVIKELVETHRAYWKLWYVDIIEFDGKHFNTTLAPKLLVERPSLKARFEELRRDDVLSVDPRVAFTMVYMHLFNYFLVESLFGGDRHYGLSEDQAIETMTGVFLKGMLK